LSPHPLYRISASHPAIQIYEELFIGNNVLFDKPKLACRRSAEGLNLSPHPLYRISAAHPAVQIYEEYLLVITFCLISPSLLVGAAVK